MSLVFGMIVSGSLFSPLYIAFGWVMKILYIFLANYGWVVLLFTILIRSLLLPLNVKQHKNMIKQQALAKDQAELARIYGNDRVGLQQAQLELMKKHGISQGGGCALSLIQLLLIWPIYQIIRAPLKYIMGIGDQALQGIAQLLSEKGLITSAEVNGAVANNISILNALNHNPHASAEAIDKGLIHANQIMDLNFFGINLGLQPSWRPSYLFGEHASTYLPLFIIPVLAVLTTFLFGKIQEWTNPMYWRVREEKELAKHNPARTVTQDSTMMGMNKTMKWIMPLFTLFTVFAMPAAMGLYWIAGNFMAIAQTVLFFYLYTKPAFAEMSARTVTNADIKRRKQAAKSEAVADTTLDGKVIKKQK